MHRQRHQAEVVTGDVNHLVFIDESSAHTAMTRTHGWAPEGERVVEAVPQGHGHTNTMIAALRIDGVAAPLVFEGATDNAAFETYVEKVLAPTLQPGDIVRMDNLKSHKTPAVIAAVEKAGAKVVRLPPYSPDMNPIEKMWSQAKAAIRKAKARTIGKLHEAMGHALHSVTADDCREYFASGGWSIQPEARPC